VSFVTARAKSWADVSRGVKMAMIPSVAGEIEGVAPTDRRSYRSPHHSASMPALVGGRLHARPGEDLLACP
jgi:magnesium chelatase family protein